MKPVNVSIVGCGYTGRRLARRWIKSGASVRGFATRAESLHSTEAVGAETRLLNLDMAIAPLEFDGQLVYYAVPPNRAGSITDACSENSEFSLNMVTSIGGFARAWTSIRPWRPSCAVRPAVVQLRCRRADTKPGTAALLARSTRPGLANTLRRLHPSRSSFDSE